MAIKFLTKDSDFFIDDEKGNEIYGLRGHDTIYGEGGDDAIYGGNGSDRLYGGLGDDFLTNDGPGTRREAQFSFIDGGPGNDTIGSFGVKGAFAEGGSGDDLIEVWSPGNAAARGGPGDDHLIGSGESEGMFLLGDEGDDNLLFGYYSKLVVGDGGSGNDVIDARALAAPFTAERIELRGGDGDDTIHGGVVGPSADPGAGSFLGGGKGYDKLHGHLGDDTIRPGAGIDQMIGGHGRDLFDIEAGDSGVGRGKRDVILDFEHLTDRIDLASIDAHLGEAGDQAFSFVGTEAFTAPGQLRYVQAHGDVILQGTYDGDRAPEFEIALAQAAFAPTEGNFIL